MIKKVVIILLSSLFLSCSQDASKVEYTTKIIEFSVERWGLANGAYASEVRIIGSFNKWGNGGLDAYDTWDGAEIMVYDNISGEFKLELELEIGETYLYCYKVKYSNSNYPAWADPKKIYDIGLNVLPFDSFIDNGLDNDSSNAQFTVTED